MTTFAESLKREISRLAKKEQKGEFTALRKAVAAHRTEIAGLKRQVKELISAQKALAKGLSRQTASPSDPRKEYKAKSRPGRKRIFSAEAFAAKRASFGISQGQMAKLLDSSSLSISKWESGKVTPRAAQLERIFAVMQMGRREARAVLEL